MMQASPIDALVTRILAADGPLPAHGEEQRKLAGIVARALDAPPSGATGDTTGDATGDGAFVTLTQAATGTGKTIAVLAPIMAGAALQKKQGVPSERTILSTFTNHLAQQVMTEDAPKVNQALKALGYPTLCLAARVGRRQFIDADRVRERAEASRVAGQEEDAAALTALLGFETFPQAEDNQVRLPSGVAVDDVCLTPRSGALAASAFRARKEEAERADIILTNHALALTDCRYRGSVLGTGETVSAVIFDEADTLPDVARSLADERIALSLTQDIAKVVGPEAWDAAHDLADSVAKEVTTGPLLLAHHGRRDDILKAVDRLREALDLVEEDDRDLLDEVRLLQGRLRYFSDSAVQGRAVTALVGPMNPALAVIHREPVRILRHAFESARSVFFISATLAAPAQDPAPNDLLRALGIAPGMKTPARINYQGYDDLKPQRFGTMRFRFADRAAPVPFKKGDDSQGQADPRHLDYVASGIQKAQETGRTLVLCTSYALVEELGRRVPGSVEHQRGAKLGSTLDAFRENPRAVLLTPAAWTGVSLPGLIDHLVIPRIPFQPPTVLDEAKRHFLETLGLPASTVDGLIVRDRSAAVRRKLAQGIGRGLRAPTDDCTLWILDPRFPLPASMTKVIGGPGQGAAKDHAVLINCIPERFRKGRHPAIDKAEIWPLPLF